MKPMMDDQHAAGKAGLPQDKCQYQYCEQKLNLRPN